MSTNARRGLVVASLALAITVSGAGAIANAYVKTHHALALGAIDIVLSDEAPVNEQGEPYETDDEGRYLTNLTWQEPLIHRVLITNNEETCWIRARSTLTKDDETFGELTWTMLDGSALDGDCWKLADDGFFYLTYPLENGSTIVFSEVIRNALIDRTTGEILSEDLIEDGVEPANATRSVGGTINSCVQVDAMQMANVTPNFEASLPWGGMEAKAYIRTETLGDAS